MKKIGILLLINLTISLNATTIGIVKNDLVWNYISKKSGLNKAGEILLGKYQNSDICEKNIQRDLDNDQYLEYRNKTRAKLSAIIKDYAFKNNIDLILFNWSDPESLFICIKEELDITDEILKEIKQVYKNSK